MGKKIYTTPQVQVTGRLKNESAGAFEHAISQTLAWATNRTRVSLPEEAFAGEAFETPYDIKPGVQGVYRAVPHRRGDARLWAFEFRHADFRPYLKRDWVTDVTICEETNPGEGAAFALRLSTVWDRRAYKQMPSMPNIVRNLVETPGLAVDGLEATQSARSVKKFDEDMDDLHALLGNPARKNPVVVVSLPHKESTDERLVPIDAQKLAKDCVGIAHVWIAHGEATEELHDFYGHNVMPYNGAVRIFMPGFQAKDFRTWRHPLYTRETIAEWEGGAAKLGEHIRDAIYKRSTFRRTFNDLAPPYPALMEEVALVSGGKHTYFPGMPAPLLDR